MAAASTLNVDKTHLSIDDHFDVKAALISIANKWKHVGNALGIPPTVLESIQLNYGAQDQSEALSQVISRWLDESYAVEKFGKPSWCKLVEAVAHKAGGDNKHKAEEIAREHPGEVEPERESRPPPASPPAPTVPPHPRTESSSSNHADPNDPQNPYNKGAADFEKHEWFHGKLSRDECVPKMRAISQDCFLIRESTTRMSQLTLTLKNDKEIRHFPITRVNDCFEVYGTFKQFTSLPDLVSHYKDRSITTDENDKLVKHCPK